MDGKPLKENDLREHAKCGLCEKKIGETGSPLFWIFKAERHGLKMNAIQKQNSFAEMLNFNGMLANIMGPNEDMTAVLDSIPETMICDKCVTDYFYHIYSIKKEGEAHNGN